ncbi:hypothetical protein [Actinophytocola sp. NPDC049390]|uniref:hypothetical protein n=1 Tax=Actinophytocola sp. NPDC049390 TaxID=3363894 RepID=UPI0037A16B85
MSQPYGQPGDPNQGYGAMPPAPPEYSSGPIPRPGTVTTAAVLAFVQAGLTLICTIVLMIGLGAISGAIDDAESIGGVEVNEGALAGLWILAIVGLVGGGLLIWGGVKALSGTAGQILVIAAGLQILLCLIWLVAFEGGIVSILLAVMPIITLVMALGGPAKQFEASRSGRA